MKGDKPRVYADLQRIDDQRRLVLDCYGTTEDLERYGIDLRDGMRLDFWMDDADDRGNPDPLYFSGTVYHDEGRWVAAIDWGEIRNASELTDGNAGTEPG